MILKERWRVWRLLALGGVLAAALACGDTSCDCVTPMPAPLDEADKLYDSVQARLTPAAFGFIQDNLTDIITRFLADGLSFELSRIDIHECAPPFDWPCVTERICENGCLLTAEIVDAAMARVTPDTLALDAHLNVSGTVTINGTFDCDVPIDVNNKPVHAEVKLLINGVDHLMSFTVGNIQLEFSNNDYELDCNWLYDWVFELLKGVITDLINNAIDDQLGSTLDDQLTAANCLPCDFYSLGCPTSTSCNGDGLCVDGGGTCLTKPLGMVGTLDFASLLGDSMPGLSASLDVFLAAGQWEDASLDPLVRNDGVEVRLIGGAAAPRHRCVAAPDPVEVPSNLPPPRLPFVDLVPGTADPYMAGIGVSDAFLDWFMYKAYLSGLFCLSLGSDTVDMLSSGTLSALLGSLDTLTGGLNRPLRLELVPGRVPSVDIGAGTFTVDGNGQRVIDEPLLWVRLPDMGLDFYVLVDERWVRVLTLTQDITLRLSLDFTPDNRLVPLFDENSISLDNIRATHYELLAEDPGQLADLLPSLISLALPMLTGALSPIELPAIEGFLLEIAAIQGDLPRSGTPYFEYLGLYANLALAPAPPPTARSVRARLAALHVPERRLMSIFAPGGPQYPEAWVEVAADRGAPAEFSWRLDGGPWRPFTPGPRLLIHDPLLALVGTHALEVRARTIGDYRSLGPAARLELVIDPPDTPEWVRLEAGWTGEASTELRPHQDSLQLAGDDPADPERVGCQTAGRPAHLAWLLLLLGALRRHRRGVARGVA